jgi:hypothetical protein
MKNDAATSRVRQAEAFVRQHLSRQDVPATRPYERDGMHVTVGNEKPLAENYKSSGGGKSPAK